VWRGDRGCVADGLRGVLVGGVAVGAVVGAVDLWERVMLVSYEMGDGRRREGEGGRDF